MVIVNFLSGPLDGQIEFYDDNEFVSTIYADVTTIQPIHDLEIGSAYYSRIKAGRICYIVRRYVWRQRELLIATPDYFTKEEAMELVKKGPR